jgi:hypothetical protein
MGSGDAVAQQPAQCFISCTSLCSLESCEHLVSQQTFQSKLSFSSGQPVNPMQAIEYPICCLHPTPLSTQPLEPFTSCCIAHNSLRTVGSKQSFQTQCSNMVLCFQPTPWLPTILSISTVLLPQKPVRIVKNSLIYSISLFQSIKKALI